MNKLIRAHLENKRFSLRQSEKPLKTQSLQGVNGLREKLFNRIFTEIRYFVGIGSKYLLPSTLLCALLLASLPLHAQSQRYQLEIIVASHLNKDNLLEEKWPSMNVRPLSYYDAFPLPGAEEAAYGNSFIDYQPLPASDWQLKHATKAFQGLKHHKLVLHTAWQQPLSEHTRNPYLFLFNDNIFPSATADVSDDSILPARELEGRIRLSQSRHLHLELDLALRVPSDVIERIQPKTQFQDKQDTSKQASALGWFRRTFQSKRAPEFYLFRLESSRKIRLGEVHLFDHPLYSVLVKVSKATESKAGTETSPVAELTLE